MIEESEEKKAVDDVDYGARLRMLRERSKLTQYDLGELVGVSWRVVYYYEKQTKHPPLKFLLKFCSALGVTADEYLGIAPVPERDPRTIEAKLLKKFCKMKELPAYRKRALYQVMEAFFELEKLKKEHGISNVAPQTAHAKLKRRKELTAKGEEK